MDNLAEDGQGIAVTDECSISGKNRMEIVGIAPEQASSVKLVYSDASSKTTPVVEGAFAFNGTNPGQSEPYPTAVEWLGSEGTNDGAASLPVVEDEFCLPAE